MGSHLKVPFLFLLVLIILPNSVWLAPPPPLAPGSPIQESFLAHPAADNVPKVGEYKMTHYRNPIVALCRNQISFQIRKKRFILGDMLNIANLFTVDILGTNIRPTNFILFRVKVSIADS